MKNKIFVGSFLALGLLAIGVILQFLPEPNVRTITESKPLDNSDEAGSNKQGNANTTIDTSMLPKRADPARPDFTRQPHLEAMTPEFKQSVREMLLLHGDMETIERPDGSLILPSRGRTTQMPIAVQMPDGSIVIKEYSEIPEQ